MSETPSLLVLFARMVSIIWFFMLTVLLRASFPVLKSSSFYRQYAGLLHEEREIIAYKVINTLREISPEAYKSAQLWRLRG